MVSEWDVTREVVEMDQLRSVGLCNSFVMGGNEPLDDDWNGSVIDVSECIVGFGPPVLCRQVASTARLMTVDRMGHHLCRK